MLGARRCGRLGHLEDRIVAQPVDVVAVLVAGGDHLSTEANHVGQEAMTSGRGFAVAVDDLRSRTSPVSGSILSPTTCSCRIVGESRRSKPRNRLHFDRRALSNLEAMRTEICALHFLTSHSSYMSRLMDRPLRDKYAFPDVQEGARHARIGREGGSDHRGRARDRPAGSHSAGRAWRASGPGLTQRRPARRYSRRDRGARRRVDRDPGRCGVAAIGCRDQGRGREPPRSPLRS